MINTIIFDLGKVLINWDPRNLYRSIFRNEKEMESFLSEVCTMDWNEQQDAGRSWQDGIDLLVPNFPKYEKEINAYFDRWEEMLGGEISGTVKILKALKASDKYRIYGLTNWSAETFPIAVKQFDFLDWFDGILVSGDEGIKKPDPAIYERLLDRYQIDRKTAVFIDDSLRNVTAAQKIGIKSIHFTDPEALERSLQTLLKE